MRKSQPVIAILGPTAVGKTRISIPLAERFEGEIVSRDSYTGAWILARRNLH